MPWQASDAKKHHKGLNSSQSKEWSGVANAVLGDTGDDAKAIRIANSQVNKSKDPRDGAVERKLNKMRGS